MEFTDTILAQVTPVGKSGVAVLRVSGSYSKEVAFHLLNKIPKIRYAEYLPFYDSGNKIIDQGIALFFSAPNSLTGEDILELQCHGSLVVIDLLIEHILSLSIVRMAEPGEFLKRAFLNDKIDLIQAEAISDLINADSIKVARLAMNSFKGLFSNRVNIVMSKLKNIRVYIEAHIDFLHDDYISLNFIDEINSLIDEINDIKHSSYDGSVLREGIKFVFSGFPNVGKSTLFNLLSGNDISIVSDIPGTTRDILREYINIDHLSLHIVDTAGLNDSDDEIEKIGIDRAWIELKGADHIFFVIDNNIIKNKSLLFDYLSLIKNKTFSSIPITIVNNKIDLLNKSPCIESINSYPIIYLSALTGNGICLLKKYIKNIIKTSRNIEGNFLARRRHLDILEKSLKYLNNAKYYLSSNYSLELLAEELRNAYQILGRINGIFTSEELFNNIFSDFCIGK
ncbi:tRNA uridine-5-carboxymethylaminomethyl(34) synthesis GTPase MnmE [Candidatus Purcelliella pentastirinorum]|nr:tRNA uridine-5-carboxymethylaminomethyl(34) synthesis GTPase MnmE [Candidatus Purcelliella pentastirinorum]